MGLRVKELILLGEKTLSGAGVENAGFDAGALLGHKTGFDKKDILINRDLEIDDALCESYFGLIGRRAGGEPLQYITGVQHFFGNPFRVDPSVLIPRPETEILVEKAIEYLRGRGDGYGREDGRGHEDGHGHVDARGRGDGGGRGDGRWDGHGGTKTVLDLCTGCGAIAVSISIACPYAEITATDVSAQALDVAQQNAQKLGVSGRVKFIQSDLFDSINRGVTAQLFDLIVTNPPYIRTGELAYLQREIKDHEPMQALDGGPDGLGFYRRIAAEASGWIREGGCLMAETGSDQAAARAIFEAAGFKDPVIFRDLAGRDRVLRCSV